jgi:hypothetical protein
MEGCRDWQTCRCSKLGNQISPFIVNKVQLETNGFIVYRHCTGRAKWSRSRITCIYYPSVVLNARSMSIVFTCLSIIFYLPLSFIMMMILLLALCLRPVYFFSIRNCVRTAFYLQIRNDDKRVLLRRNKRHLYCKCGAVTGSSIRPCWSLYSISFDWCDVYYCCCILAYIRYSPAAWKSSSCSIDRLIWCYNAHHDGLPGSPSVSSSGHTARPTIRSDSILYISFRQLLIYNVMVADSSAPLSALRLTQ